MPRHKLTDAERGYLRRVGKLIREKRLYEYHELQRHVARRAKISTQYLWSIEHGNAETVSVVVMKRIAAALQLKESDLIEGKVATEITSMHCNALLDTLAKQLEQLSESERPPVIMTLLADLENYRRLVKIINEDPHQLAFSFAASKREASRPRWFSAQVSSEVPS